MWKQKRVVNTSSFYLRMKKAWCINATFAPSQPTQELTSMLMWTLIMTFSVWNVISKTRWVTVENIVNKKINIFSCLEWICLRASPERGTQLHSGRPGGSRGSILFFLFVLLFRQLYKCFGKLAEANHYWCDSRMLTKHIYKPLNTFLYQVRVPRVNSQGKVKTFKCKQCEFVAVTKLEFWKHGRGKD